MWHVMSLNPRVIEKLHILSKYYHGACSETEYVRQEEKHIWLFETGTSPQFLCMVASREKLTGRRHWLRKNIHALCSVCLGCPLVVLRVSAGRFMSHFVSCTVTHGCVLCSHGAQLQGCTCRDGDAALEGWAVGSATIIINSANYPRDFLT
jgi:hypothetical protein